MTEVNKKISDPETLAITRESAGYRVQAGVDGRRCGECRWFEAGLCTRGIIGLTKVDADDACEEFRHTLADGSLSHQEAEVTMQTASHLHNRHLFINRVSEDPQTGVRRWYSTSSGVKRDLYGERMSKSLFRDFIRRIELRESPPEPFTSKAWTGGLPYLGVAHYLDLEGEGIAGDTVRVWPDGTFLKMKGTFANNKLGNAAYDAIKSDIKTNVPHDERVRVSIAFVDYGHEHEHVGQFERKSLIDKCPYCEAGKEDKIYQKGQLVHLALTRRPAYPEADIQLEEKSMSQRKDDAASIVGEELAESLEASSKLTERSADIDPDAIVVREDAPEEKEEEMDGEDEEGKKKKKGEDEEESEEEMVYESLGGAKSLDEADSYITSRSKDVPLLDSWAIFASVLVNIAGDDNTEAVYKTVSEFQERLDIMALRALMKVSDLIEREEAVGGEEVVEAPVEAPAESAEAGEEVAEPAVEANPEEEGEIMPEKSEALHPLDEALVAMKDSFDAVMAEPMSETERLIALQEPVNALAASIKRSVEAPVDGASIGDGEAVKALVAEAVAPFMAEIARLTALTAQSTVEPKAPVRRAITVGNTITVPTEEVKPRSGFTPLKNIVRRSVGLNED